eukprot:jgi/Tetstr1/464084/TSEL_008889.t1
MSTFADAPTRRSNAPPVKKTLDREHARIAPAFVDAKEEEAYYRDTAHLLFHYYDSVEKGSGVVATAPAAPAPVGSHKVTVGLKQRSVLDFIKIEEPPGAKQGGDGGSGGSTPELVSGSPVSEFVMPGNPRPPPDTPPPVSASKYSKMSRAELLDSFMRKVSKDYAPEPEKSDPRYMRKSLAEVECGHCGSGDRVLVPNEGFLHCLQCDTIEYVTLDSERPSYRDPPRELSYLCYKRSNHLNEWLSQTQGREYTNIPDSIYDSIMIELKRQKISNLATLERKKLKEILKKLGLNRYFEHLNYIHTLITGKPGIRIPPNIEAQFKRMFAQIQVPFLKHAPPNRKNHISYSFALSRMADLLGYDEIQEYLPKLKSKAKREEQNRLWKLICGELGWEFSPQE